VVKTRYSSYDDERNREKPVRLDRTEGTVVIEGRPYPAKEVVEALAQSGYSDIRHSGDELILGRKRISPIFKSRQERAMASLCHGSLAYCCPLSKRCMERDRALEVLGLTKRDYEQLKGNSHYQFLDSSRVDNVHDRSWQRTSDGRTANRPATDRGFGSDNYRRDFDKLDQVFQPDNSRRGNSWRNDPRSSKHNERSRGSTEERSIGSVSRMHRNDSLMDEMQKSTRNIDTGTSCSTNSEPSVEGLGALFSQGELSPFKDNTSEGTEERAFCFSCGRTFEKGTKLCPYCGTRQ